ncbi:hypothetical protein ABPG75_009907 [Micractinium tetrahymenae]
MLASCRHNAGGAALLWPLPACCHISSVFRHLRVRSSSRQSLGCLMTSPKDGAPPSQPKTKAEALDACAEQHHALVTCFKTCSFGSAFTGCCTEEHKQFWDCYTRERGSNQTRLNSWLDNVFNSAVSSVTGSKPEEQQPQQQPQQQQQQAQRKQ